MPDMGEMDGEVSLQSQITTAANPRKVKGRVKTYHREHKMHEQGPARAVRQVVIGPLMGTPNGILLDQNGHPNEVIFLDP